MVVAAAGDRQNHESPTLGQALLFDPDSTFVPHATFYS